MFLGSRDHSPALRFDESDRGQQGHDSTTLIPAKVDCVVALDGVILESTNLNIDFEFATRVDKDALMSEARYPIASAVEIFC
jgi:hypothetical protein